MNVSGGRKHVRFVVSVFGKQVDESAVVDGVVS